MFQLINKRTFPFSYDFQNGKSVLSGTVLNLLFILNIDGCESTAYSFTPKPDTSR